MVQNVNNRWGGHKLKIYEKNVDFQLVPHGAKSAINILYHGLKNRGLGYKVIFLLKQLLKGYYLMSKFNNCLQNFRILF
jgi:hypothetical protein